jgi:hypothetical protein
METARNLTPENRPDRQPFASSRPGGGSTIAPLRPILRYQLFEHGRCKQSQHSLYFVPSVVPGSTR